MAPVPFSPAAEVGPHRPIAPRGADGLELELRSTAVKPRSAAALTLVRDIPLERLFAAGFRLLSTAAAPRPEDRAVFERLRAMLEPD